MGETEVAVFLSSLAVERHVAASTQNQALSALIFLYGDVLDLELDWLQGLVRAKRPERLPVVLTQDEVARLLSELRGTEWLMASLMYGAGLRLTECAELRVKDLDLATREVRVRDGKGRKDRVTVVPTRLVEPLAAALAETRRRHQSDVDGGAGWVALPDALGRKFPNAGREIAWQWVFPATRTYVDAATGQRRVTTCTNRCFSVRSSQRWRAPDSPSGPVATRCAIRLQRTCSRRDMTSGRFRNCSATATSARR